MMRVGLFLPPPTDVVAEHHGWPLLSGLAVVVALVVGVVHTRRTRSPLFIACAISGAVLYPFLVEPLGDMVVATWYPPNQAIIATVFDRPIPWFVFLGYAGGIPLVCVAAYELVRRGAPAQWLLLLAAAVSMAEVPIEIAGHHFGWMSYYGNHAVVLGIPIYCLVQNGGMFVVVAWALAKVLPHIRGLSWVTIPFLVALCLPAYAIVATWPAYLAIHLGSGPVLGWTAGLVATGLNLFVVVACANSPTLAKLRNQRAQRGPTPVAV